METQICSGAGFPFNVWLFDRTREVFDVADARTVIDELYVRKHHVLHVVPMEVVPKLDQALRLAIRELAEKERAGDGEDSGVRADAKGQGKTATTVKRGLRCS